LALKIALSGTLSPALRDDAVALLDEDGAVVAHYGLLHVTGADGAVVPSRLEVDGDAIILRIDDAAARYPLAIDPFVWAEQAKLLAGDGAADDAFGMAVSASGDTALVGAQVPKYSSSSRYCGSSYSQ
jgi:hypothetical protein